jgi:hypothetical protein
LFYNFCHKNLDIFALPSSAVLKPAQAGLVWLGTRPLESIKDDLLLLMIIVHAQGSKLGIRPPLLKKKIEVK